MVVDFRLSEVLSKSIFPEGNPLPGIKMMKKQVWNSIEFNSKPIGWAFAFELSIKVIIANYKVCEIPFKSVDRLFGGKSTFKVGAWTLEYLKWFFYGILKLNIFKN